MPLLYMLVMLWYMVAWRGCERVLERVICSARVCVIHRHSSLRPPPPGWSVLGLLLPLLRLYLQELFRRMVRSSFWSLCPPPPPIVYITFVIVVASVV